MTPRARLILRTYAEGMAIPYRDVCAMWLKLDQVGKCRAIVEMRKLEIAWQEYAAAKAQPTRWGRFKAAVVAKVRMWRSLP